MPVFKRSLKAVVGAWETIQWAKGFGLKALVRSRVPVPSTLAKAVYGHPPVISMQGRVGQEIMEITNSLG